jgi:hypothetical protein
MSLHRHHIVTWSADFAKKTVPVRAQDDGIS